MELHDMLDDRETQSGSSAPEVLLRFPLPEFLEDAVLLLCRDADAGVGDDQRPAVCASRTWQPMPCSN